jgi:hypothetical protein
MQMQSLGLTLAIASVLAGQWSAKAPIAIAAPGETLAVRQPQAVDSRQVVPQARRAWP